MNVSLASIINNQFLFIPLDILGILCMIFVIILSLIYLSIIIFDRTCHTIPLLLIGNTCLTALFAACCILSMCTFTLYNDVKQIDYPDSFCVFRGYTAYVSCALFNFSFLLQALYRYVIVVYPRCVIYQSFQIQFICILFNWIYSFVYPLVFTLNNEIIYDVDNQICQLPFRFSFSIIYVVHFAYLIPVLMIMFIYLKLVRYVRRMNRRITPVNRFLRARQELKMVQHTVMIIAILVVLCFPYAFFIFMSFFTRPPKYHFRISYIFADISILSVMLALFYYTDILKEFFVKKCHGSSNATEIVEL